ncbi:MAG: zinc metalloprotease HtpX [Dehalococcoidia bacterium]|nr:zinc metalloprotease HtpX [Dehalococcoidia bacterium]
MNMLKTGTLFLFLTFLLLLTGYLIGGVGGILFFLVISVVMNFLGYWFSDKMVLAMARAKEATQEDTPELHRVVEEQVRLAGIPKPRVFIIESDSPNAFATGRSKRHASIAATRGILRILDREELGAVLAHELAHVGNQDTLIMTMVATVAGTISMIASMAQWSMILGGGRRDRNASPAGMIGLLVVVIVMPLAALLIRLAISRTREYQADKTGALTSGRPMALATALRKLQRGTQARPLDIPKERLETVSHLFIVNPLRGDGMVALFSTHPPMEERIRRLEAMQYQSLWPDR